MDGQVQTYIAAFVDLFCSEPLTKAWSRRGKTRSKDPLIAALMRSRKALAALALLSQVAGIPDKEQEYVFPSNPCLSFRLAISALTGGVRLLPTEGRPDP